MILGLLLAAILSGETYLLLRAWLGAFAPDTVILVAALCGMVLPPRRLLLAAVLIGWGRALVLLEPAGGQVLCAFCAMSVLAGLRSQLVLLEEAGWVLACIVGAGCWSLVARLLSLAAGEPILGGRELLLGAALSLPLAGLARRAVAGAGAAS